MEIREISASWLRGCVEGVEHRKTLPCLSVVQAVHSSYEIGLDGGKLVSTGEGGIFVAPAKSMQRIIHHNGSGGYMEARWAFFTVKLNGRYQPEDIFLLPLVPPREEIALTAECIETIRSAGDICASYAAAYRIMGRLIALSKERPGPDEAMVRLKQYILEHYPERIAPQELAREAYCSVPHLYRLFRRYFSMTPANYINRVRLENAAAMLERGEESVSEVAAGTGFDDMAYFSRLFKEYFTVPPTVYRQQNLCLRRDHL